VASEAVGKPLFHITIGELGTTPSDVEATLRSHFRLASRWNCVLLLTEADPLLPPRTQSEFVRHSVVSVFLKSLEYYSGVLFLTTDNLGQLDEAVGNQIHLCLRIPSFDRASGQQVLAMNLSRIADIFTLEGRKIEIEMESVLETVRRHREYHPHLRWNGRQIRNACQAALAIAERDAGYPNRNSEVVLRGSHMEVVCQSYFEFYTDLISSVPG